MSYTPPDWGKEGFERKGWSRVPGPLNTWVKGDYYVEIFFDGNVMLVAPPGRPFPLDVALEVATILGLLSPSSSSEGVVLTKEQADRFWGYANRAGTEYKDESTDVRYPAEFRAKSAEKAKQAFDDAKWLLSKMSTPTKEEEAR